MPPDPNLAHPPAVTGSRLGVVIGSSLRADEVVTTSATRRSVDTPWGGREVFDTGDVIVVHRHGVDEFTPAHRLDHRATAAALCLSGCNRVLALASVGSLHPRPLGTVVAPLDFYAPDATASFHDDERGHSVPGFDQEWRDIVIDAWRAHTDTPVMDGGVYAQTRGPRFETAAEVRWLRGLADIVGMTIASECIVAKEAGLAYAALCTVDNLANGIEGEVLTIAGFQAGVAANRSRLLDDLRAVLPHLARG